MVDLELDKQPAGVGGEYAQESNEYHTWNDTTVEISGRSQQNSNSMAFDDCVGQDTHTLLQVKTEVIACLDSV